MIKQHLTFAFRRLAKNKVYTILNVFGLSVGLACFAMIGAWMKQELSFDRFHEKSDRIYRVVDSFTNETGVLDNAITSPPLGPALPREIPEIEKAIRVDPVDNVIAVGDKRFLEQGIVTDPAFFDIFDFKTLKGKVRDFDVENNSSDKSPDKAHIVALSGDSGAAFYVPCKISYPRQWQTTPGAVQVTVRAKGASDGNSDAQRLKIGAVGSKLARRAVDRVDCQEPVLSPQDPWFNS